MKKKSIVSVISGLFIVSLIGLTACKGILGIPHVKENFSNVKNVKICQSVAKYYTNPPLRMDRIVNGEKQSFILDSTQKQYIVNYLNSEIQNSSPSAEELRTKLTELGMQCNQDSCSVDCGYTVRESFAGYKKLSTEHFPIKIYLNLQQGLNSLNPYWQQ